jgi:hypothetical protein
LQAALSATDRSKIDLSLFNNEVTIAQIDTEGGSLEDSKYSNLKAHEKQRRYWLMRMRIRNIVYKYGRSTEREKQYWLPEESSEA